MFRKKIITYVSIAFLAILFSGCVAALQTDPRAHYIAPIEGVEVIHVRTLPDVEQYQQQYTLISQVKSNVFLNNRSLSVKARNLDANFIAILTIQEQFKLDEHYMYYFFKK